MTKYNNSKIYKIEPIIEHAQHEIYIGSTTKERLCQRMAYHRGDYKAYKKGNRGKIMAFDLFDKYGIENCQIILIEEYKCNNKDELTSREANFIRNTECINKVIPDRDKKEYNAQETRKAYYKQYREKNTEARRVYEKEYREDNKEIIKQKIREYYEYNKETINEKKKEHYQGNKEEINKKRAIKVTCECGCVVRKGEISRHIKTKKHIDLMKQKEEQAEEN